MWIYSSIAGAPRHLRDTINHSVLVGIVLLSAWGYFEIGTKSLTESFKGSKFMLALKDIIMSDVARGFGLLVLSPLVPICLVADMMNQFMRKLLKRTTSRGWFTDDLMRLVDVIRSWNWSAILMYVHFWSVLYWTVQIAGMKISYVFLSWLNDKLQEFMLWVVVIVVGGVGLT